MLNPFAKARLDPELEITVDEAFEGVARTCEIKGIGKVAVRLAAGLRDGDVVELERGRRAVVRIAAEPGRAIVGDDLRLSVPVDPRLVEDGGRIEVETPFGPRVIWSPPGLPTDALLKIRDCGLPAREERPQGHAFVKLEPDPALSDRVAREMLDRFTAAWTPNIRARRLYG
jgi:curved DNA-binding protein